MRDTLPIAILCALTLAGCLAKELKTPTERHAAEARIVAERCRNGGYYAYPCDEDLTEDLEISAEQAELIQQIVGEAAGGGLGGAQ